MSRKSGYYWVILKGSTQWCIGDYDSDTGEWEVGPLSLTDNYISKIDPNPIVREEEPQIELWDDVAAITDSWAPDEAIPILQEKFTICRIKPKP